ncbi:MAG: hypothetical protein GY869_22215 [Planctomycetes bacterium]|nr:hypothetical protein [Planctomycetota bacterium]
MKKIWKLFLSTILCCGLAIGIGMIGCGGGSDGDGGGSIELSCTEACGIIINQCGWGVFEDFGETVSECTARCDQLWRSAARQS